MTRHKRTLAGFTLLEVLVALAIIAIALIASLRALASLIEQNSSAHSRLLAGWSAQSVATELYLEANWIDVGQHTQPCPQAAMEFQCILTVNSTPNPAFRRVDIRVVLPSSPDQTLAQVITLIPDERNRSL